MSKIGQATEEILEKISFGSYTKPIQEVGKKKTLVANEGRRNIKKTSSLFISQKRRKKNLMRSIFPVFVKEKKCDRSALFAEAVDLLHKKECQVSK